MALDYDAALSAVYDAEREVDMACGDYPQHAGPAQAAAQLATAKATLAVADVLQRLLDHLQTGGEAMGHG